MERYKVDNFPYLNNSTLGSMTALYSSKKLHVIFFFPETCAKSLMYVFSKTTKDRYLFLLHFNY